MESLTHPASVSPQQKATQHPPAAASGGAGPLSASRVGVHDGGSGQPFEPHPSEPQPCEPLTASILVAALKAAAEPTRLRILMLLADHELNVKDLTQILGQSQPRLSRHLKLLVEAGLLERAREGSWVYFHVSGRTNGGRLTLQLLAATDPTDPELVRDRERAYALRRQRETVAQRYFETHAGDWDRLRALHVSESEVEAAMLDALGPGSFDTIVDLGTGTGRTLELLAGRFDYALGIDANQAMLAYARSKIEQAGLRNAHVRHGDIYNLPLDDASADAVVMHQVLHYLTQPAQAIAEAARILKPGGKLLIVDFAPHDLEFLRTEHAHERLGFSSALIEQWMRLAGLEPGASSELAPTTSSPDQPLTVSLWQASQPAAANATAQRPNPIQETGAHLAPEEI